MNMDINVEEAIRNIEQLPMRNTVFEHNGCRIEASISLKSNTVGYMVCYAEGAESAYVYAATLQDAFAILAGVQSPKDVQS